MSSLRKQSLLVCAIQVPTYSLPRPVTYPMCARFQEIRWPPNTFMVEVTSITFLKLTAFTDPLYFHQIFCFPLPSYAFYLLFQSLFWKYIPLHSTYAAFLLAMSHFHQHFINKPIQGHISYAEPINISHLADRESKEMWTVCFTEYLPTKMAVMASSCKIHLEVCLSYNSTKKSASFIFS